MLLSKTPKRLIFFDLICALAILCAFLMVMFYAPVEISMGAVQKLFYFHVSVGWVGMLGFLAAMICGVIYLKRSRSEEAFIWDMASLAGVEIGLVFMALCIASGSIWAKPIWNTWWTWDPRLTTSAIMVLIYLAYLMLRRSLDDPDRRARFSAVYAILGSVSVPLTFFSIRLFRTIHPVLIGSGTAFTMDPYMLRTFSFCLITFTILFIDLFWHRILLGQLADSVEQAKQAFPGER
jgi:heme exporter protein C